uniref:Putative secreted protein n=1 Tax=Panstrongylus lignarius TaxID=156445 RepID=A0A224Y6Y5_9HEMI
MAPRDKLQLMNSVLLFICLWGGSKLYAIQSPSGPIATPNRRLLSALPVSGLVFSRYRQHCPSPDSELR